MNDSKIQGQLASLVTTALDQPTFASGRTAMAFDEIFGKPTGVKPKPMQVNMDLLKTHMGKFLPGVTFPENVYSEFIDYVSVHPRMFYFTKVKFVAAMNHLIIMLKPEITKHFKEQMPGMTG
jgi:hypothetical protein